MSVVAKNEKVIKLMKDGLILGGWIHHGSGEADGGHAARERKKTVDGSCTSSTPLHMGGGGWS